MNNLFRYALESSAILAVLWIFYELLLGRDARHRSNRYFLLGSMFFSLVVPLLEIKINGAGSFIPSGGIVSVLLPGAVIRPASGSTGEFTVASFLLVVYGSGVILSVLSVAGGLLYPVKLLVDSGSKGKVIVFRSADRTCFSTLGRVFISSAITGRDAERMINHEMKHIRMGHHSDLLLITVIRVLQWFNPVVYLLRRRLTALHEFEADDACLSDGEDPGQYTELLLSSVFRSHRSILTSYFSGSSLLKNRIIMMTMKRTGKGFSPRMLMAVPVALVLMFMFACNGGNKAPKEAAAGDAPAAAQAEAQPATPEGASMELPADVFKVVEQMPVFMGDTTGQALRSWLVKNIDYPKEAHEKGIQGKVFVEFIIDEQGNLTSPKVIKSADPLLDKAALDMMAGCPKWEPGKQGGVPVKVSMTLPITFALQ